MSFFFQNLLVIWVKLTQGIGRGTCWWNISLYLYVFLYLYFLYLYFYKLIVNNFLNFFFINFNFILNFYEELFVVFFVYNFIKIIIFSSILELLWPTHFFNNRNNNIFNIKLRTIQQSILKIKKINYIINFFNKKIINYFF